MQEGMAAMMRPIYFAIFPELTFFLVHWLLKIFFSASLCCANWTSQMPALRNTPPGPLPGDLRQGLQVQGPKELTGPRGFCPSLWEATWSSRCCRAWGGATMHPGGCLQSPKD